MALHKTNVLLIYTGVILMPCFCQRGLASLAAVAFSVSADAEMYQHFERLDGPPYVPALIEYAESYGVAQEDITAAIFDGTFVPHPQDIRLVKIELDSRSCEEMAEEWLRRDLSGFDCEMEKGRPGAPGDIAWNEIFGAPSEEMQFRMAQRFPRHRDSSEDSWQRSHVSYEDVKDLRAVKTAMYRVSSRALPSVIESRSMNDQYGPTDFGGVFEKSREAFVLSRGGGTVEKDQPSQVAGVQAHTSKPPTPQVQIAQIPQELTRLKPSAQDIQSAIQTRVDYAFSRLDAMGEQCSTFRRDNNPIAAMMCLFSGGGSMNSRTSSMGITSVHLDHCLLVDSPEMEAYCYYRASASMAGSGMMGQVASLFNATSAFNQWTWGSFQQEGQTWRLIETWDQCTPENGVLYCTARR